MNEREAVEARFPKLVRDGYSLTSPSTDTYNCVAWVARDVFRWWSPEEVDGYYWPWSDKHQDLSEYLRLFEHLGFEVCPDGALEGEFEKIAIYAEEDEFDHVAFQRSKSSWSSKLGELADIRHDTPASLQGEGYFEYAPVTIFMRRPREPHPLADSGLLLP